MAATKGSKKAIARKTPTTDGKKKRSNKRKSPAKGAMPTQTTFNRGGNTEWTHAIPNVTPFNRDLYVEEGKGTTYDLHHQVVLDVPPPGLLPPGTYHPLCCSVRTQFHTDGFR